MDIENSSKLHLKNDDSQKGIAISYANTVLEFSDFWQ